MVSDSLGPHGLQPTRLLRLWDSPGEYWSGVPLPSPSEQYAAAKSLQLCPTLCDPIDGSPPGSPVPGIQEQVNTAHHEVIVPKAGKWEYDCYLNCFLDYMFRKVYHKPITEGQILCDSIYMRSLK